MNRRGITRTLLIRVPVTASIAGSNVVAARTDTSGINMPPRLIERSNGSGRTNSDSRPSATVSPEIITERPAWVIVCTSADSTSLPSRSSSRNRKIINSA